MAKFESGQKPVFIVEAGEKHEGSFIVGIFATYDLAYVSAFLYRQRQSHGRPDDWKLIEPGFSTLHTAWELGCDVCSITEYVLQEYVLQGE